MLITISCASADISKITLLQWTISRSNESQQSVDADVDKSIWCSVLTTACYPCEHLTRTKFLEV